MLSYLQSMPRMNYFYKIHLKKNIGSIFLSDFESLAEKTLHECYTNNPDYSQLLLLRQMPQFDKLTCLQVAISAQDQVFVSHPATQGLLTNIWYNKIQPSTSKWKVKFQKNIFPFK